MHFTTDQLYDLICQMVRVGFVSVRDPDRHRVRVEFQDITGGAIVSDWLQVLAPRAWDDQEYDLPDEGEQVLCLFLPFGRERGFVLGSMYGAASPPVTSGDKWHRKFKDGTWLEYDRASHELTGVVVGDVNLSAGGSITAVARDKIVAHATDIEAEALNSVRTKADVLIEMTAPNIIQNGNVTSSGYDGQSAGTVTENAHRTVNGSLTVNGPVNINGNLDTNGNSSTSGNSTVSGNSFAATRSGGPI